MITAETETACANLTSIRMVNWLNKNGYYACSEAVVIPKELPDDFPIEVHLDGLRIGVIQFGGGLKLKDWVNDERSRELAKKISLAFNVEVSLS